MVDYREWVEKAKVFLVEAREDLEKEKYWLACFHAQQFAELVLKAILLKLTGSYLFTHSLVELLESIEALGYHVGESTYTAGALEKQLYYG